MNTNHAGSVYAVTTPCGTPSVEIKIKQAADNRVQSHTNDKVKH